MKNSIDTIKPELLRQVAARGKEKSICPSEVARSLADSESEWRALMPTVRAVAIELAEKGEISILQKGEVVKPPFHGPIRLKIR